MLYFSKVFQNPETFLFFTVWHYVHIFRCHIILFKGTVLIKAFLTQHTLCGFVYNCAIITFSEIWNLKKNKVFENFYFQPIWKLWKVCPTSLSWVGGGGNMYNERTSMRKLHFNEYHTLMIWFYLTLCVWQNLK